MTKAVSETRSDRAAKSQSCPDTPGPTFVDDIKRGLPHEAPQPSHPGTVHPARGCGAQAHTSGLNGPSIRLETVVTEAVADRIMEMLADKYFDKYATVAWVTEARVARPSRF